MTAKILLRTKVSAAEAETFIGRMLTTESFDALVTGDADVFKPNGQRLCSLVKGAISDGVYEGAREALEHLRSYKSLNRGLYAGGHRALHRRQDGTLSSTTVTVDADGNEMAVSSAIVGFFERTPRMPFCRATAFTQNEPSRWRTLLPLAQAVAKAFSARVPDRYAAQMREAQRTHPAYVISGTPFTTMTVNNTVRGACHRDAGDLKEGFGCISAMRIGSYGGHFLVFPEYRVAVDIGPNDLLLFDPHEMHGNTPMVAASVGAQRISVVYYFRNGMQECLAPEAEARRAAEARGHL